MRSFVLAALLLLAPLASAGHLTSRDLEAEVEAGAAIVLVVEGTGAIVSGGTGSRGETRMSHEFSFPYRWSGTIDLTRRPDGTFFGDANIVGGGEGRLVDTLASRGGGFTKTCEVRRAVRDSGGNSARAHLDPETGELLVVVPSFGEGALTSHDCTTTYQNGMTETTFHWPAPPLSPTFADGMRLVGKDARMSELAATLDEENAANALVFAVRLDDGHTVLRRSESAQWSIETGPLAAACPQAIDESVLSGSCTASGTLHVRVVVNPCKVLRESRAVHLAAVKALQQPPSGSSEAQVRAFALDARQKVQAWLADERALQLICGEEDAGTMTALADAQRKVRDAWLDVAEKHGLSDQGKRDLLAAERGHQLSGGGEGSARSAAVIGEVISNPGNYGRVVVKVHSPVALHAWDEQGRHVGWNDSTDAPDVQIEDANYTGEPGAAQELSLPSGFYKLAVVELSEGSYLLHSGWNGTAGEGAELLPAASEGGRTLVMNVLLDEGGYLVGPAQRIATASDAPFAFVEAWKPLDADASALGRGGAPGAGERAEPGASVGLPWPLLVLAVAAALVIRRR